MPDQIKGYIFLEHKSALRKLSTFHVDATIRLLDKQKQNLSWNEISA